MIKLKRQTNETIEDFGDCYLTFSRICNWCVSFYLILLNLIIDFSLFQVEMGLFQKIDAEKYRLIPLTRQQLPPQQQIFIKEEINPGGNGNGNGNGLQIFTPNHGHQMAPPTAPANGSYAYSGAY
jgi:hypothetical protein